MHTITATAWHPYPQFNWQFTMLGTGVWATVNTSYGPYARSSQNGVNTRVLEIDDPQTGEESSLRCIIGSPEASSEDMNPSGDIFAPTVTVTDDVHVTINILTWSPNLEQGKIIILSETPID